MTINGLDISAYQEMEWMNKYINWDELAKDPRQFKMIWIKSSEGELTHPDKNAYPVATFDRQVAGAEKIGLLANPYHFYYYHVPMSATEYYVLSPAQQAIAFEASLKNIVYPHPLVDLEDPYVGKFLQFTDTTSANKALDFAKRLNNHIQKYLYEVEIRIGRPDIYTGAWWWDTWARLLQKYSPVSIEWMANYKYYVANYTLSGPIIPLGVSPTNVIAWQYTSSPTAPVQGFPDGSRVDMAQWVGSDKQWVEWSLGMDTTEPPTYDELTARVDALEETVKLIRDALKDSAEILDKI